MALETGFMQQSRSAEAPVRPLAGCFAACQPVQFGLQGREQVAVCGGVTALGALHEEATPPARLNSCRPHRPTQGQR